MGVKDKIIEPLQKWFDKPINQGRVEVYYELLGSFSDKILENALREIKETWNNQAFPQPGTIRQVCIRMTNSEKPLAILEQKKEQPWETQERLIATMVADFMEEFKKSELYFQVSGKWSFHLLQFIENCAFLQARIHHKSNKASYCASTFSNITSMPIKEFVQRNIQSIQEKGYISVEVPSEVMQALLIS